MGYNRDGRRRHIPNAPKESLERDDVGFKSNIPQKVFDGLTSPKKFFVDGEEMTRLEYARKKGYITTVNNSGLKKQIHDAFKAYYTLESQGVFFVKEWDTHTKNVYREVVQYLVISDVARLITAGDWQVDRVKEVEKNFGMKSGGLLTLQRLIGEGMYDSSSHMVHFHKGQGNGALMLHLESERQENQENNWRQVGVSDKLYFPIEDILIKRIKRKYFDDPAIQEFVVFILAPFLKKALKSKWFSSDSSTIRDWKQEVPFCDMNDAIGILNNISKNPQLLLQRFNTDFSETLASGDFTDDTWKTIPKRLRSFLYSLIYGNDIILLERQHGVSIRNLHAHNRNKEFISQYFASPMRDDKTQYKFKGICKKYKIDTDSRKEDIIVTIQVTAENDKRNIAEIKEMLNDSRYKTSITSTHLVINDLFDLPHGCNLNQDAYLYFGGVSLSFFTDKYRAFGENFSPSLITSSKGDSHEDDEDYIDDLRQDLLHLKKGGVYMSDGSRTSFLRTYRYDLIEKLVSELNEPYKKSGQKNEYKALVPVNAKNHYHNMAICIMRRGTDGMLFDADYDSGEGWCKKDEIFSEDIILVNLHDAANNPFIHVITTVRRRVFNLTKGAESKKGDVEIMRGINRAIVEIVNDVLLSYYKIFGLGDTILEGMSSVSEEELLDIIKSSPSTFSQEQTNSILRKVENKVRALIVGNSHIKSFLSPEGIGILGEGDMTIFPKEGEENKTNIGGLVFNIGDLPKNQLFRKLQEINKIDSFKKRVRNYAGKHPMRRPILFLDYVDCITNELLNEKFVALYGKEFVEEYIEVISVHFHADGQISNRKDVHRKLEQWKRFGGIVIGGGSWKVDAYNKYGQSIKSLFEEIQLYEALLSDKSRCAMLGICVTHQVANEVLTKGIWEKYRLHSERPKTEGGMFKFLPLESQIVNKSHPLVQGWGESASFCHSNSGQFLLPAGHSYEKDGYQIVARDSVGAPSIISLGSSYPSFISSQFHPEINPREVNSNHVERLENDMKGIAVGLELTFGKTPEDLMRNYRIASSSQIDFAGAGDSFLIRSLDLLSMRLIT